MAGNELFKLNKKEPLLTIGLLVGSRKDTLNKCLSSLTHLRENVDSELVVVVTSRDDSLFEEISAYTDKVFYFKWIDDFAAARNECLKYANGKWFMYLDDDEWFEDTAEIEDFFATEKYKKYEACWYVQRNYHEAAGLTYSDDYVSRMRRLSKGVRFVSTIHEYIEPYTDNYYYVHSYVHHFGYVYEDDKAKYKHYYRNINLLKKMLIKEPGQLRWWMHIVQEYWSVKEYEKLRDFCNQAFDNFKDISKEVIGRDIASFYMAVIESCYNEYDYEEAIKWGQKALNDGRLYELGAATVYETMARSYVALGDMDKAAENCQKYFEIYEMMKDRESDIVDQSGFLLDETFERKYYEEVCWFMVKAAIVAGDKKALKEYLDRIEWEDQYLYVSSDSDVPEVVRFLAESDGEKWYANLAESIMARSIYIDVVVDIIKEYEKKASEGDKISKGNFERIARIMIDTSCRHYYIEYLRVLFGEATEASLYNILVSDTGALNYGDNFWEQLQEKNINLEKVIEKVDFEKWKALVEQNCSAF